MTGWGGLPDRIQFVLQGVLAPDQLVDHCFASFQHVGLEPGAPFFGANLSWGHRPAMGVSIVNITIPRMVLWRLIAARQFKMLFYG